MNKKRYVTNLKELHSLAEQNYAGLLRLLPEQLLDGKLPTEQEEPSWRIQVGELLDFELSLGMQAPYTTDVLVRQLNEMSESSHQYHQVEFIVRLYHDARMAEITDYQGAAQLTSMRPGMFPKRAAGPDEKRQLSHLLADWVKLCIHHGRSVLMWEYGNELQLL